MTIAALEAGGTKMVCAIGNEKGEILARSTFPTETPEITLPAIAAWFGTHPVNALGIACFGPIDLNKESPSYGFITSTPKLAWRDCDIVGFFKKALQDPEGNALPIGFDTDVNCACLGEATWGNARDVASCIYITVGTGIGVGVMVEKQLLHGLLHPEAGHILIDRIGQDDYAGKCPYHRGQNSCLEGLAYGPAIEERWGEKASQLAERSEVWELEASYLAKALVSYILTLSPERIIIGGGVMKQSQLFPLIRAKTAALLNDYLPLPDLERYIVPPALGDEQAIMGAFQLAMAERL
jgi:fructokinase